MWIRALRKFLSWRLPRRAAHGNSYVIVSKRETTGNLTSHPLEINPLPRVALQTLPNDLNDVQFLVSNAFQLQTTRPASS